MPKRPLGLYIHWPYCISKCPYCDFNSFVGDETDHSRMRQAYLSELHNYHQETSDHTLQTLFFGGGTPSLMPPSLTKELIETARILWGQTNDIEITLEANPATVDQARFEDFREAGINRLSLGIQSLDDEVLQFLGRKHSAREAIEALKIAKAIFPKFSFDLIYAYLGQTLNLWEKTLKEGLEYANGHLSLYQLTIEPGTAFYNRARRGEALTVEDDLGADLYDLTNSILSQNNFLNYEVSNYAQQGHESQHNLIYWRYQDYIGIGPGAHGRYKNKAGNKIATSAIRGPEKWANQAIEMGLGLQRSESLERYTQALEKIMMGLRLSEGLDKKSFLAEIGNPLDHFMNRSSLKFLKSEGYIRENSKTLALTPQGRNNLNSILKALV